VPRDTTRRGCVAPSGAEHTNNNTSPLTLAPASATKADVEAHFATHGTGEITEIKLMNGFGFIEYKDAMDARDVVPGKPPVVVSVALSVTIC
jgi:hypothetical protein